MQQKYILKLYIVGSSAASELALRNLKEIISQESETYFDQDVA
jgi:hypothetical protein